MANGAKAKEKGQKGRVIMGQKEIKDTGSLGKRLETVSSIGARTTTWLRGATRMIIIMDTTIGVMHKGT